MIIIGSIVINSQYFFTDSPGYIDLSLNSTTSFRLHFPDFTPFTMSLTGTVLNVSTYFFRDVVLLVVQCILAIISISLLKKYFNNKKNVLNRLPPPQNSEIVYSHNSNNLIINITNIFQSNNSSIRNNINKNDHKLTVMIVIMSLLSVIEHFLFLAFVVMFTYFVNENAFLVKALGQLYIPFKHFLNFFLLFLFNNLFRKETKKSFGFY